jgi:hypothetical protein
MRHRIAMGAVVLALALLYVEALDLTVTFALALAPQPIWSYLFSMHGGAAVAWYATAALVVVLPCAYVFARIVGRGGVLLALALAMVLYVFGALPAVMAHFNHSSTQIKPFMEFLTPFDAAKLLCFLPGLVCVFGWLIANDGIIGGQGVRHRVVLGAVALALALLYTEALVLTVGVTAALAPLPSWYHLFSTRAGAVMSWTAVWHTMAVLVVALPFAYVIARIYGRVGVLLALTLTGVIYAIDSPAFTIAQFNTFSTHMKFVTLLDAVKLLGFLPGLVWVFGRLPIGSHLERMHAR